MKLSKLWKKTEDGTVGVHFCKKCGCPLESTNKGDLCDYHRRIEATTLRNTGAGILSLAALFVFIKRSGILEKALGVFINRKL
jgi:hypothetical protein